MNNVENCSAKLSTKISNFLKTTVFGAGLGFAALTVMSPAFAVTCDNDNCTFENDIKPADYNGTLADQSKDSESQELSSFGSATLKVGAGQNKSLTGNLNLGENGSAGVVLQVNMVEAVKKGQATYVDSTFDPSKYVFITPRVKGEAVKVIDPVTGIAETVNVYGDTDFTLHPLEEGRGLSGQWYIDDVSKVGNGYLGATLAVVNGAGATLDVNLSRVDIAKSGIKRSTLFRVEGDGGNLNYQSQNRYEFMYPASQKEVSPVGIVDGKAYQFNGEFTPQLRDGTRLTKQNVTDKASFYAYNAYLKEQIAAGKLGVTSAVASANYDKLIRDAYREETVQINWNPYGEAGEPTGNAFFESLRGTQQVFGIEGKNSVVTIEQGASVHIVGRHADIATVTNGGQLINRGVLSNENPYGFGIRLESGAQFINYGQRSSTVAPVSDYVIGTDTRYINYGIQNVSTRTNYASNTDFHLRIYDGGYYENNGSVNVAYRDQVPGNLSQIFFGTVRKNGTLLNNGVIYIGRRLNSIGTEIDPSVDVPVRDRMVAIIAEGAKSIAENKGTIILGSKVQNSVGMWATSNYETKPGANDERYGTVTNSGTIRIDGKYNESPQVNYGIYATGYHENTTVLNTGKIELNGANAWGLYATNGAVIRTTGIVNVGGSNTKGGLNNYGAEAIGNGSRVEVAGKIRLTGTGAIGIVARSGGTVDIQQGGAVEFDADSEGATGQIGYLVSGNTSKVNSGGATQNVSAKQSVLIRIQDGATFEGTNGDTITASGEGSTGYYVTGGGREASSKQFVSGGMTLHVANKGARGVVLEGGTKGLISAGTNFDLSADEAIGVVVDGQAYGLAGEAIGAPVETNVVSNANIFTNKNAVGYIVQNKGVLTLAAGTVKIQGDGIGYGVIVKSGTLKIEEGAEIVTNGYGIKAQGADSVLDISGANAIQAIRSKAAISLSDGAELTIQGAGDIIGEQGAHGVLLDDGAKGLSFKPGDTGMIKVSGGGNGIENQAETAGLSLRDVRIEVSGGGAGVRTAASLGTSNSGEITVLGNKAIGLAFQNSDGTSTGLDMDMSDSANLVFKVDGVGSVGILANTTAKEIKTGASVNVGSTGGTALKVIGETTSVINSGSMVSKSSEQLLDLSDNVVNFTNSGKLEAGTVLVSNANGFTFTNTTTTGTLSGEMNGKISGTLTFNGNNTTLVNEKKGIMGDVALSGNDNVITLSDTSKSGTIKSTGSNTTFNILNGEYGETSDNTRLTFTKLVGGIGTDTLNMNNSKLTLDTTRTSTSLFDKINVFNVNSESVLTLNDQNLKLGNANNNGADGRLNINTDGTVVLNVSNTDWTWETRLGGSGGLLQADLGGTDKQFKFAQAVADDQASATGDNIFSGTFSLKNATLMLGGYDLAGTTADNQSLWNTQVLKNTALVAGDGSKVYIRDNYKETNIGSLKFDGGHVDFGVVDPFRHATHTSGYLRNLKVLDLTGTGIVDASLSDTISTTPADSSQFNGVPLLAQDTGKILVSLANADKVDGAGNQLKFGEGLKELKDAKYDKISNISQQGAVVAKGTYRYRFTTEDGSGNNGLFITYGLDEVELLENGDNALIMGQRVNNQSDLKMGAKITGTGDLVIGDEVKGSGYKATVVLANSDNDYSGLTSVIDGYKLVMNGNNVLGKTSGLNLASGTTFNADGFTQDDAGKLTMASGAVLRIGSRGTNPTILGDMTFSKGADVSGGVINLDRGTLTFDDKSSFKADTLVNLGGGTLNYKGSDNSIAGSTVVTQGGTIVVDHDLVVQDGQFVVNGGGMNLAAGAEVTLASELYDSVEGSSVVGGAFNLDEGAKLIVKGGKGNLSDKSVVKIGKDAVASIDSAKGLGASVVEFADDTGVFDAALNGAAGSGVVYNSFKGAGSVNISNSNVSGGIAEAKLNGNSSGFTGDFNIAANSRLTIDRENELGNGKVDVAEDGFFNIASDNNVAFNNVLTGDGTLEKNGNGVLILGKTSQVADFAGNANLYGGKLFMDGADFTKSTVNVFNGAELIGYGDVGDAVIKSGGALHPGNGTREYLGSFTVRGDLTFEDGSRYYASIDAPLNSTMVQVDGKTTLNKGAIVDVTRPNVFYTPDTKWIILRSQGGVVGEFNDTVFKDDSPYLDMKLTYEGNDVVLWFTKNYYNHCLAEMSSNECSVAHALDGNINALTDAVDGLSTKEAKHAMNKLSGEGYASSRSIMIEDSRYVRETMNNRLRVAGTLADQSNQGWWMQGVGAWNEIDAQRSAAKIKRDLGGMLFGYDTALANDVRFGVLAGYTRSEMTIGDYRSTDIDVDSYHIGAYLGKDIQNWQLRGGVAYTWNSIDSERDINITGKHSIGYAETAEADYNASTTQVFGEVAYDYKIKQNLSVLPYLNLAYVHLDTDGFTEKGRLARLNSASQEDDVFFSTLGLRGSYQGTLQNGTKIEIVGGAGWRYANGDTAPNSRNRFVAMTGSAFDIKGVTIDDNAAVLDLGVNALIRPNVTLGISYSGQFGKNLIDNAMKADFKWKF